MTDRRTQESRLGDRQDAGRGPALSSRSTTARRWSSNTAATPWARRRWPGCSPPTRCCSSCWACTRWSCTAAARRSRAMLERAGVKSTFVDGLRVTDEATMEVAEMVLSGAINKEIANWITQAGAEADVRGVGLSGKDARLITVEKATAHQEGPRLDDRAGGRPGLRRRADAGRSQADPRPDQRRRRLHPGDRARSASPPTARPTTSTPTPWPGALAGALKAKRMLLLTDVAGRAGRGRRADPPADRRRGPGRDRRAASPPAA